MSILKAKEWTSSRIVISWKMPSIGINFWNDEICEHVKATKGTWMTSCGGGDGGTQEAMEKKTLCLSKALEYGIGRT
jgi:hypothetical protein